jgi:hypothetical protein
MRKKLFTISHVLMAAGVIYAGVAGGLASWDHPVSGRESFMVALPGLICTVVGVVGVVFLDNDPPSFR